MKQHIMDHSLPYLDDTTWQIIGEYLSVDANHAMRTTCARFAQIIAPRFPNRIQFVRANICKDELRNSLRNILVREAYLTRESFVKIIGRKGMREMSNEMFAWIFTTGFTNTISNCTEFAVDSLINRAISARFSPDTVTLLEKVQNIIVHNPNQHSENAATMLNMALIIHRQKLFGNGTPFSGIDDIVQIICQGMPHYWHYYNGFIERFIPAIARAYNVPNSREIFDTFWNIINCTDEPLPSCNFRELIERYPNYVIDPDISDVRVNDHIDALDRYIRARAIPSMITEFMTGIVSGHIYNYTSVFVESVEANGQFHHLIIQEWSTRISTLMPSGNIRKILVENMVKFCARASILANARIICETYSPELSRLITAKLAKYERRINDGAKLPFKLDRVPQWMLTYVNRRILRFARRGYVDEHLFGAKDRPYLARIFAQIFAILVTRKQRSWRVHGIDVFHLTRIAKSMFCAENI